jgi:hypothetical protein
VPDVPVTALLALVTALAMLLGALDVLKASRDGCHMLDPDPQVAGNSLR